MTTRSNAVFCKACQKATKLLTAYEIIFNDLTGKYLSPKEIARLNSKRDAGTIINNDLPGRLNRAFPGESDGKTLDQIREECTVAGCQSFHDTIRVA